MDLACASDETQLNSKFPQLQLEDPERAVYTPIGREFGPHESAWHMPLGGHAPYDDPCDIRVVGRTFLNLSFWQSEMEQVESELSRKGVSSTQYHNFETITTYDQQCYQCI